MQLTGQVPHRLPSFLVITLSHWTGRASMVQAYKACIWSSHSSELHSSITKDKALLDTAISFKRLGHLTFGPVQSWTTENYCFNSYKKSFEKYWNFHCLFLEPSWTTTSSCSVAPEPHYQSHSEHPCSRTVMFPAQDSHYLMWQVLVQRLNNILRGQHLPRPRPVMQLLGNQRAVSTKNQSWLMCHWETKISM